MKRNLSHFKAVIVLVLLFAVQLFFCQVNYVSWNFNTNISGANYASSQTNRESVKSSQLGAFGEASDLSINNVTANVGNTFHRTTVWSATQVDNKYIEFSITANNGYVFPNVPLNLNLITSVNSIDTAPRNYLVKYSWGITDNFVNLGSPVINLGTGASNNDFVITAAANTNVLKIRIYAYGKTGGNFQIRNLALTASQGLVPVSSSTITTGAITGSPFCITPSSGTVVQVPFSATGDFDANNVFTAQLSNASGSFATPINIGTTTTVGVINGTIPAGTVQGTGYKIRVVASFPNILGNSVDVAINNPATISTQSTSAATYCVGANSTNLTVTASNALSYQWYLNTINNNSGGTLISGANASTYKPLTTTVGTSYYYCVVTGSCGTSVTSAVSGAIVVDSVPTTPNIGNVNIVQNCGETVITYTGGNASNFFWQTAANGVLQTMPANVARTLTSDLTYYLREKNNNCWSTALSVPVVVVKEVVIEGQPISQTVFEESTAIFSIYANNVTTYQWQVDTGNGFVDIIGANTSTYEVSNTTQSMTGTKYRVILSNSVCSAISSSEAELTVTEAPCFNENFASITLGTSTGSTSSSSSWLGNENFPTVSNAFQAGGAIRIGTGSNSGKITSRPLDEVTGNVTVNIKVKGWTTKEGDLKITLGNETKIVLYANLMNQDYQNVSVDFDNVAPNPVLIIETYKESESGARRAFIDEITLQCTALPPVPPTYYRSKNSGTWDQHSTWESSEDGVNYLAATRIPTRAALEIKIRSGHRVEISTANISMTETTVETGGILEVKTNNVVEISGNDEIELTINDGGIFLVNSDMEAEIPAPGYIVGNAFGLVKTGGKVVAGNSMKSGSYFVSEYIGANLGLFYFENGGIAEWNNNLTTLGSRTPDDYTLLRPLNEGDIPILRISATPAYAFGANSIVNIINGILELENGAEFGFQNSGKKVINYGVRGNGSLIMSTNSGELTIGKSSVIPILDGNVVLRVKPSFMKLVNGANIPLGANIKFESISTGENGIINREADFITVNGTLDITNMRINNANAGGIIVNGKLRTTNTGGLFGSGSAIQNYNLGKLIFNSNSEVEYYSSSSQKISNGLDYHHLRISNVGTKTATGTTVVNGMTYVDDGVLLIPFTQDNVLPNVINSKKGISVATNAVFNLGNNAVLLQDDDADNSNAKILLERSANVPADQYNLWSSPVVGQNMYNLYSGIPYRQVMVFSTVGNNFWAVATAISEFGKGYSVRGSSSSPTSGGSNTYTEAPITSSFEGKPNNGNGTFNVINTGSRYNLVGNPYPSNLDLNTFYTQNASVLDFGESPIGTSLDPTMYLWDNNSNIYLIQQSNYSGQNYAIYNALSGVGVQATSSNSQKKPIRFVKPGQAFLVRAKTNGQTTLVFNNLMRTSDNKVGSIYSPYFKNGGEQNDKFWLKLKTPSGLYNSIAIIYNTNANNQFDLFDSKLMNNSANDLFYSLSDDEAKLAIQGRKGHFSTEDHVRLGMRYFSSGQHTISLEESLGVFGSDQKIYLRDLVLNQEIDLREQSYTFSAIVGDEVGRFQIVYKPGSVLSSDDYTNSEATIYTDQTDFVVKSKKTIQKVELYDMMGRLINVNKKASKITKLSHINLIASGYILKVYFEDGVVSKKVVK